MKPTITLIHDTRRAKTNGKYPVKVRLTYNRKQKYYPTGVDLSEDEWTLIQAEKVPKSLTKAKNTLTGARAKAADIVDELKVFSFPIFEKQFYKVRSNAGSLETLYNDYIADLKRDERIGTASSYQSSINSLKEFRKNINTEDVTTDFLKQYEKWMISEENSLTTVGIYLRPPAE